MPPHPAGAGHGRLTAECPQAECSSSVARRSYAYDPVGNRTSVTDAAGASAYAYDVDDQLLSVTGPAGSTDYAYDADGNQTRSGETLAEYDAAGRVVRTDGPTGSVSFGYDGESKRLLVQPEGSAGTQVTWDTAFALPQPVIETTSGASTRHVYGNSRIASVGVSGAVYHHGDDRGSVTSTTDAAGTALWSGAYDAFGVRTTSEPHAGTAPGFGWVGQQLDPNGQYHLRARQYDPGTGRFTTPDPAGVLVGDPYVTTDGYGLLRPTLFVDASGLCIFCMETVRGFSEALNTVASTTAAVGAGIGVVASGATVICPVCAPVTGTVAAVSFTVAGVAGAVAIGTGAFNTAVDCYQAANGYAPIIDGASCAKSAVGVAVDVAFLGAGRLAGQAVWPKRGLLANSSRATRRNASQAATGAVEVAGYGFGRGVQRLFT